MRHISLLLLLSLCVVSCGNKEARQQTEELPDIFPNYINVTVPCNIAPLNFMIKNAHEIMAEIELPTGEHKVFGSGKYVNIPLKEWQDILRLSRGKDIEIIVSQWDDKHPEGIKYKPFTIHISEDVIDPWVAYRLIPPGYENFKDMGIYERQLTSFEQKPIIVNKQNNKGCLNCHSFANYNPENFMFHARGKNGGTVICHNGKIEKREIKKDMIMSATYNYWHPSSDYIAFTANITRQSFYGHSRDKIEVYDMSSDLFIYDVNNGKIIIDERFNDSINWETFPSFTPDGKTLYFCTAKAVRMPMEFAKLRYSIVRTSFNADGTLGETIDTVYSASAQGGSALTPRISPDGKYMMFALADCGAFHIHHKEADLKMVNLETGEMIPTDVLNTDDVESYHSWSSNGKWVIFSSKRVDTRYTRLFVTHWDGKAFTKPFMIPAKNPENDIRLLCSYNIPEFIKQPVEISKDKIADLFQ